MMKYLKLFITIIILNVTYDSAIASTFVKMAGGSTPYGKTTFNVTPSGLTKIMNDTFGLEGICIKLSHTTAIKNVSITLIAPDGTSYILKNAFTGITTKLLDSTIFTDTGTSSILNATGNARGNYKPENALKPINKKGTDPNAKWQISIQNWNFGGSGSMAYAYLIFGNHPATGIKLDSSILPIISINTKGRTIVDDPKINVKFNLIFNNSGKYNHLKDSLKYKQFAGMELRGSSSNFMYPKKSYGLETRDSNGVKLDTALLGMPSENDWVLLANYSDKTLMRNSLAYHLANEMGHYASRTRFVELVINGAYMGVYVLGEKIKRDKERVSIKKITAADTGGDAVTGGYIFKVDKTTGSSVYSWQSKYKPADSSGTAKITIALHDPDTLNIQQKTYIKTYVEDSFEKTLKSAYFKDTIIGWRRYAHEKSFIDYFILNELANNVDGYRYSTYLYKDRYSKKQGKIHVGPAWDYDLTFHNANFFNGASFNNWAYKPTNNGTALPFWWMQLMKDPIFTSRLKCRWQDLRKNVLSDVALLKNIDSMSTALDSAKSRNFKEWTILGTYVWPNPVYPPTYKGEIDTMKNWIKNRTAFLDKNMPGTCVTDFTPPIVKLLGKDTMMLAVFNHLTDSGIYAFDAVDSFKLTIKKTSTLDTTKLGFYKITYTATDKSLNSASVIRVIKVIDTIAPTLYSLNGNNPKYQINYLYNDKDVFIKDNYDKSSSITVKRVDNYVLRNAKTIKIGNYKADYTLTDLSGNKSTFVRTYEVIDTFGPAISLVGGAIINLKINDPYTDSGYKVVDDYYAISTIKIDTISDFTGTSKTGDFQIKYKATDSMNNVSFSKTRMIHVDVKTSVNSASLPGSEFSIYPNPVTGNSFNVSTLLTNYQLSIFDITGKQICTYPYHASGNYQLPASIAQGIYLIEIKYGDNIMKSKLSLMR